MLTAYDALMAKAAVAGEVDILLVGDSLGRAVLGYQHENQVTLADILHHAKAVIRGAAGKPVVADLPFGTYENPSSAIKSAEMLMETGITMVKPEGALLPQIEALSARGIPVMAHLGYTPQSASLQGSKVVGNTLDAARELLQQSKMVEKAGALALVLEMVPREVAKTITDMLSIPVLGIGSGPDTDGQVLVTTDMWGENEVSFKFLHKFAAVMEEKLRGIRGYAEAVRSGAYPADQHSFHIKREHLLLWQQELDRS